MVRSTLSYIKEYYRLGDLRFPLREPPADNEMKKPSHAYPEYCGDEQNHEDKHGICHGRRT